MLLPFDELKSHNFTLSDINVIHQNPAYRMLNVKSRVVNGFLYVSSGMAEYKFDDEVMPLSSGAIAYLPVASRHKLIITSPEIEFYRVDFTLHVEGKLALFSSTPLKITDNAPHECIEAIHFLEKNYRFENNTIIKTEMMCKIFSSLQKPVSSIRAKKLAPALRYMNEHLTERFNCSELASMCYLSTAQFYTLFVEEYGLTPLQYRDKFLIQRSKLLLKSDGISVGETAFMLGFDNQAYFSRFFKKHMKISPIEYKNKL